MQALGFCVFAFLQIAKASSKSALSSTKIWQSPLSCFITGIREFSLTKRTKDSPPRGIITSIKLSYFISSSVTERSVLSIKVTAFSSTPLFLSAVFITFTMALFELKASFPPFKITAFPLLKQSEATSVVTFGRDS